MVDPHRLPDRALAAIRDRRNHLTVSAASFWELAIKQAKGKLDLPPDAFDDLRNGPFRLLSITPDHAVAAARLPPHHGDPFDRLLIAQARAEGLTLVGSDGVFVEYDVGLLWD